MYKNQFKETQDPEFTSVQYINFFNSPSSTGGKTFFNIKPLTVKTVQ